MKESTGREMVAGVPQMLTGGGDFFFSFLFSVSGAGRDTARLGG